MFLPHRFSPALPHHYLTGHDDEMPADDDDDDGSDERVGEQFTIDPLITYLHQPPDRQAVSSTLL
jgi:hypothetical protein